MRILGNKEEGDHLWLTIESDPKILEKIYSDHLNNVSKRVNIPGFRKGHAPMSMVIQTLKSSGRWIREFEYIVNRVIGRCVELLGAEHKDWDAKVFGYPVDSKLDEFSSEKWIMVFQAKFEKYPGVELGDYSVIPTLIEHKEPDKVTCPITDNSKEIEEKDVIAVAMVGKNSEGGQINKYTYDMLEIDLENTKINRAIVEALLGAKAKDKKSLEIEDNGEKVSLEIWVIEVRRKEVVNEDMVKKFNLPEGSTVEKLHEVIEKQHYMHNSYVRYHDILKWLFSSAHKLTSIPVENLKRESAKIYNKLVDLGRKDISFENVMYDQSRNLKTTLVLNEIAKREKFEVTDEDKTAFVKDVETHPWLYGNSNVEDIMNCSEEMVKEYILQFKTINFLIGRWTFSS